MQIENTFPSNERKTGNIDYSLRKTSLRKDLTVSKSVARELVSLFETRQIEFQFLPGGNEGGALRMQLSGVDYVIKIADEPMVRRHSQIQAQMDDSGITQFAPVTHVVVKGAPDPSLGGIMARLAEEDKHYLVQRFVDGEQAGTLKIKDEFAKQGIIMDDPKGNVLLNDRGDGTERPVIIDFGYVSVHAAD